MKTLSLLLPVLIIVHGLFAPAISQTLPFRSYTMADGLPSNVVLTLLQDSRGFLRIGIDEGFESFVSENDGGASAKHRNPFFVENATNLFHRS